MYELPLKDYLLYKLSFYEGRDENGMVKTIWCI